MNRIMIIETRLGMAGQGKAGRGKAGQGVAGLGKARFNIGDEMNFKIKNANAAVTSAICIGLAALVMSNLSFVTALLLAAFGAYEFYIGVEIYDDTKRKENKKTFNAG